MTIKFEFTSKEQTDAFFTFIKELGVKFAVEVQAEQTEPLDDAPSAE